MQEDLRELVYIGGVVINAMPDDTCRTIKAAYAKTSTANMQRASTFGATGVLEVWKIEKPH